MNKIENLLTSSILYPIIATPEGLEKTFILNYLFEALKGFFGYANQADLKSISFHSLRLLKEVEKSSIKDEAAKIVKFATHMGLLPSKQELSSEEMIARAIGAHLKLSPLENSFEKISECYEQSLRPLNQFQETPDLAKIPVVVLNGAEKAVDSSWKWKLALGVTLATSAIFLMWSSSKAGIVEAPQLLSNLSLPEGFPEDFSETLSPICERSVKAYCSKASGSFKCLKEYLDPTWTPKVTYSKNDIYPVCMVELAADRCKEVIKPGLFSSNFERITALFENNESTSRAVHWATNELPGLLGAKVPKLWFKTILHCPD